LIIISYLSSYFATLYSDQLFLLPSQHLFQPDLMAKGQRQIEIM